MHHGVASATGVDDLQLALWLAYEQHYRGLAGVDDRWEWHPELVWARRGWEQHLLDGLRSQIPELPARRGQEPSSGRAKVQEALKAPEATERGLFRESYVTELLAAPDECRTRRGANALWQVALLEIWLQTHGIT